MQRKEHRVLADQRALKAADTAHIKPVSSCLLQLSNTTLRKTEIVPSAVYFVTLNLKIKCFPVESRAYKSRVGVGHCHMKTCDARLSHRATSEDRRRVGASKSNVNSNTYHLQR